MPEGYIFAGRCDRTKHGGGVLVFLRDSLLYSDYDTSTYHIPETAEMVAVRIEELGVVIITVYAQPSEKNTDLFIALEKLQAKIEADGLKSVICGDFNAHNKEFLSSPREGACSFLSLITISTVQWNTGFTSPASFATLLIKAET